MELIAISNLPWDSYFPPDGAPALGAEQRTHRVPPEAIARYLTAPLRERLEGEAPGGSPTNVALAYAAAGGRATVAGPIAGDAWGDRVGAALEGAGIGVIPVSPAPAEQAHSVGFMGPGGERRFLATMPRLLAGAGDVVALGLNLEGAGWLVSSSYELADAGMRRFVLESFAAARVAGRRLAFDLADPECVREHHAVIKLLVQRGLDVAGGGPDAIEAAVSAAFPGAEERQAASLARTVFLTRGAAGVTVFHGGGEFHFAAAPAAVRDTTGAGDAFLGAYLYSVDREVGWQAAVRRGLAAAGACIGRLGAH